MKKKLLMVAVGAALATGAIAVNAAPTVYGHFHYSFDKVNNDSTPEIDRSGWESNSARFGIRGDEDLGGGLKVLYQVEGGAFSGDEGTAGFGGTLRNTFVGLSQSTWGTVKIGRHDTPYKVFGYVTNGFIEQVGDARNVLGSTVGAAASRGWDLRASNALVYESPSFAGVQVNVLYSGDDNSPAAGSESLPASTNVVSASVRWTSGPLMVGGAYEKHGLAAKEETGMRVGASYDFGMFKVAAQAEQLKDLGGTAGADRKVIGVAGSVKIGGNTTVDLGVHQADELDNVVNTGGSIKSVGVHHNLSKTTQVYVNYATTDNDDATTAYNIASSNGGHSATSMPSPTTVGASPKGISAGVIVNF